MSIVGGPRPLCDQSGTQQLDGGHGDIVVHGRAEHHVRIESNVVPQHHMAIQQWECFFPDSIPSRAVLTFAG
ncbi:MAG: hypothetical protein MUC96_20650, partial [Myxococcaceae bacterium]|nr:hypothetical protein [Myxococcaceae bacterium]